MSTTCSMSNAEIWTNLIGPARSISRADKFFEMGEHSLLGLPRPCDNGAQAWREARLPCAVPGEPGGHRSAMRRW